MKWLIPALACMLLSACVRFRPTPATLDFYRNYTVGAIDTAAVGAVFIRTAIGYSRPAYRAVRSYVPPAGAPGRKGYEYSAIPEGMQFGVRGVWRKGTVELFNSSYRVTINGNSSGSIPIWIDSAGHVSPEMPGPRWTTEALFEPDTARYFDITDDSYVTEIVYSGSSGTTLYITGLEYRHGLRRLDRTNALRYDLEKGRIIAYRNIRIEVIEAGNLFLVYRVISDR